MNNLHYDFYNTGYKIHLPVVPDANDPLTRKIVDYLDQKFGLQTNNNTQYNNRSNNSPERHTYSTKNS